MKRVATLLCGLLVVLFNLTATAAAHPAQQTLANYDPDSQTPDLFYDEARAVYLGNLERRKAGVPPLRWNRELTRAARWFAWDSIANRPAGWIGHQDTLGGQPLDRVRRYGYLGAAGAENAAYASYPITPEDVISMWMNSSGHRANLLDANSSEIGVGYYTASDGRTYVVQDFGSDPDGPPLVIENEAPGTTSQQVSLYQYASKGGGLEGIGPPTQMMISNSPTFAGAAWQPYQAEVSGWTLALGEGWKTVYTKIRDSLGRTSTASDSIYLGAQAPTSQLSFTQLSQTSAAVTLACLNSGGMTRTQFSLVWALSDDNFKLLWGSGGPVSDAAARGGSDFRLNPANGESSAWGYVSDFIADTPMLAYFRLKVSSNASGSEAARIMVQANTAKQTVSLKGSDFQAANQYQEFAVPFTYHHDPANPFLIFQVWRSGSATVDSDDVAVFTASQPFASPVTWTIPGGHYRGQGVWVRFANDSGAFTPAYEAGSASGLSASPAAFTSLVLPGKTSAHVQITVSACGSWSVASAPGWLGYTRTAAGLEVWDNASGMSLNSYQSNLVLRDDVSGQQISLPVRMIVVQDIHDIHLPLIDR